MRQSPLGLVSVVFDDQLNATFLKCDHSVLGGRYEETGDSVFGVFYLQEAVMLLGSPPSACLVLGLGAAVAASGLQRHGVRLDVFELDPAVAEAAQRYFGFELRPDDSLFLEDARLALKERTLLDSQGRTRALGNYDVVLHDLFTGGGMPAELFTVESFQAVKAVMRPAVGVLVVNFYGFVNGQLTRVMFARLRGVFAHVRVFRDEHNSDSANMVFFASDTPLQFHNPHDNQQQQRSGKGSRKKRDFFGGSAMREDFLVNFINWELRIVPTKNDLQVTQTEVDRLFDNITREHWHGIRQVLPPPFWLWF